MSNKHVLYVLGAVVIVAIVVAGYLMRSNGSSSSVFQPQADKYYSVFLSNNQVYFGKIGKTDDKYLQLTSVYYLSMSEPIQPLFKEEDEDKIDTPKFTLIKLGRELHDPIDEMIIGHDQVLFIEQLQDDSRIIQAIDKAKAESIQS